MTIHVVMGPPCSGKSTFVDSNRKPEDPRIDFDKITEAFGNAQPHNAPRAIAQITFAARTAAIARAFDGVDADVWLVASKLNIPTLSKWLANGVKLHLLDPGKEECLRRARADGRPERSIEFIEQWYENPPAIRPTPEGADQ